MQGAALEVSERPDDTTFTIRLGKPSEPSEDFVAEAATTGSISADVTIFDDGAGSTLTASGEIKLTVSFDKGIDFDWGKLQYFKLIAIVEAEERVTLTASSELAKFDLIKKKIATLRFASVRFLIAGIPVWITPTIDVYLFAEGKIEAEATFGAVFQQRVEGGLLYNKDTGFSPHTSFTTDSKPIPPSRSISASIKGGVEAAFSTKLYSVTGPSIPMERYVKIAASAEGELFGHCTDIAVQFAEGSDISFKWDMSGSTKIGKLLHLDQLEAMTEFSISASEGNVAKWTVYSTCPRASFLTIEGDGIFSTIDLGDPNGLATTLTVSNIGDEDLHWNTTNGSAAITISPSSGVLAPGAEEIVQMSVATADLPVGRYLRKPFFYNEASLGQDLPDEDFGNTRKTVDIIVNNTGVTDTPVITSAVSNEPGQVVLDWDLTPSGSYPLLGFAIYATETPADPDSYHSFYTTNSYERQAIISGLKPSATYSFKMRGYSNYAPPFGPYSNVVSAQIAGNPPSFIPSALNDTGITWSGNYKSGNNTACVASTAPDGDNVVEAQDCSHGRDTTHNDDSDGHAGFSYTKLDSNGVPLADQSADYATTPWACVKDNVTGLIWEVKTDDSGLHDKDDKYTWYNTDPTTNGGNDGYADYVGNTCYGYNSGDASTFCNTEAYVNRINAAGWCGASNWRMPTRKELMSIVDLEIFKNPAVDTDYFPNTMSHTYLSGFFYWTGTSDHSQYEAYHIDFYSAASNGNERRGSGFVRLVRSN